METTLEIRKIFSKARNSTQSKEKVRESIWTNLLKLKGDGTKKKNESLDLGLEKRGGQPPNLPS